MLLQKRAKIISGALLIAVAALAGALMLPSAGQGQNPTALSAFQQTVQPFLVKHCYECHGPAKQSGDIRFDRISDDQALADSVAILDKSLVMVKKGAMPPSKKPQPSSEVVKPVVAWLENHIEQVDKLAPPNPGPAVLRRLNRAEYNNTVRDLLGVELRPADDFPPDDSAQGFDNIGAALSVAPLLLERYLKAAEQLSRTALFGVEPLKPAQVTHQPWYIDFSKRKLALTDYDETGMALPGAVHVMHRFPVDGDYDLRAYLRGFKPAGSEPVEVGYWLDGKLVKEFKVSVPRGGELNGLWTEFRIPVKAGEHWLSATIERMYEGLAPSYKGPNPSKTATAGGKAADEYFLSNVAVTGPFNQLKGPTPESIGLLFPKGRDKATARDVLAGLTRRAYRRPVTDADVNKHVAMFELAQKDGESFEESLCIAIQSILMSPHFLFRVEAAPNDAKPGQAYTINDYELASRLSYFLWSTMPDTALFEAAAAKTLHRPEVLEDQVQRMLQDPKAGAFVENFGGQWLQFRALESHIPDRKIYQEYTDYTSMSMRKETSLFFEHIIKEDRPVIDFLDANYTFLNERLANFYGIPGVKGHEFRKVDLTGTPRGGVWTQGSVLTVSSYAHRTSPVLRGKWVLENLLNAPPPNPPPDVPNLNEAGVGKAASLRQRLEEHRANATCASCHARMDPIGFGMENFDPIGAWREKDGNIPIDSSGTLPDGQAFKGASELRKILATDKSAFAACLTEKMLVYALGRGLERYDRRTVKGIVERAAAHGYRFSSIVLGIVNSVPFQERMQTDLAQSR